MTVSPDSVSSVSSLSLDDLERAGVLSPNALAYAHYWKSLPKVDLVPERSSFDPVSQRAILSHFAILELVEPGVVKYRLAGTAEAQRYGQDVTGKNYLDFVNPERRAEACRAFEEMAGRPCGMLAIIHSTARSGRHVINESLGFPMRGSDGRSNLLYFQSNTASTKEYYDSRLDVLDTHVRVSRRLFIDIGAGVPTDFG